jgi:chemosensory pili system protein ChpA (sensor histidine kinase/response regulator)
MQTNAAASGDHDSVLADLGPLAWVLDELRKSLDGATKAMRRFVRDAELARGADLAELDASHLRIARQQLHQAVGALEMVGLPAPAKVLRAMEALAQRFVQRPELCSDVAANKLERASFALTEYLEGVLKGKDASPVALFPQYRDVLELAGGDRVHPADLWTIEWRWVDVSLASHAQEVRYAPGTRARVDQAVLKVVKTGDSKAATAMRDISLGLSDGHAAIEPRVFWKISAAFFEAIAQGLCPADVYVKRVASRVILQYTTLARGETGVSDRLAQDMLFFCAQAIPVDRLQLLVLPAVRAAYGLTRTKSFAYETTQFGRFDPALLVQARKRIAAATETWSALAGGDTNRLKMAVEQFGAVSESILKLHPECGDLARALTRAIDMTAKSGEPPSTPVAMEIATSVLYLEAAYADLDPTDSQMAERSLRLAHRLEHVVVGGQPEALESWMEELYRRVSDRQTMGSVVDELRTTLGEIEKSLDQFFRNPKDKAPLHEVPSKLAQMRGVFSVLGLDQASLATLRLRDSAEQFLVDDINEQSLQSGIFEKLGNSLGALGFLIDMLSYQRALAKKLFVYDEELGEFKPLMGREKVVAAAMPEAEPEADFKLSGWDGDVPRIRVLPEPALVKITLPDPEPEPEIDQELREIFLEEAREVVLNGLSAVDALALDPADLGQQTTLRRAFHTLKGSSRMVGLNEFGEAAWSLEQLLNTWLAEQKAASDELVKLSQGALQGFGRWVEDIATGRDPGWFAQPFREAADGLRLRNLTVALNLPGSDGVFDTPQSNVGAEDSWAPTGWGSDAQPGFEETHMSGFLSQFEEDGKVEAVPVVSPEYVATQIHDFAAVRPSEIELTEETPASTLDPLGLDDIDFGGHAEPGTTLPPVSRSDTVIPAAELAAVEESVDQVRVIGSLKIGIPLYNVFLNEADEWSRRLLTELSEWALELHQPIPDTSVWLAHSLAGSSGTVGFAGLSEIARALEQALQHVQLHAQGTGAHAQDFIAAAEEIRHLLHQFAAGFLKEPGAPIVEALQTILDTQFPALTADSEPEPELGTAYADLVSTMEDEPDSGEAVSAFESVLPLALQFAVVSAPQDQGLAGLTAASQRVVVDVRDDDMDLTDVLDADLFPIFEEEALELLPQLGGALRQWAARPDNLGARGEVLRVLHTLKGSARLSGAMRLGEAAHRMESAVEYLGLEHLETSQLEPLLTRFDGLRADFDQLRATPEQQQSLPEMPLALIEAVPPATPVEVSTPLAPTAAFAPIRSSAMLPVRPVVSQSVRVRSQLLDRLVNQAGEVMITRSRLDARLGQLRGSLGELTGNLDRLRHQLRDIEVQAESQMQSRLAQVKDSAQVFDPLEFDRFTRVQELTRMMAESVNDVATVQRNLQRTLEGTEDDLIAQARQARELQRDLLRTRMVEFESISERLYSVVRQASKDSGKQVKLDINGGSMEMDRGVLERMAPAFEHILRNAVAHGIEIGEVRTSRGKPPVGNISISLHHQSNDVSVEFADDGAGLDLTRIRSKALASGMTPQGTQLSDTEVADLIFMPGLSTASEITELSGRGIGMDVVRAEVNALGGRIETATQSGLGTQFRLVLPLTTAVTQVVMLRQGAISVGVPANIVEIVKRVPAQDLERAYQNSFFEHDGEQVPLFWAGALLQTSAQSGETHSRHFPVAIFRSAGQRIAVHVDEVLGNQEVVVKNLGPQMSRLPGLTGMSILASGAVVLIYNPVALATVYGDQARQLRAVAQAADAHTANQKLAGITEPLLVAGPNQIPLVLVVDDSITVRRVTQRLLLREGYRVAMAADGLQALERLQEEKPAVVLSDIEMPRMDGFDLVRNIRADEKLRDLPVIMITSRIAEKHRDHAKELGVDHYLGKPYSEDELLSLVRGYCFSEITG